MYLLFKLGLKAPYPSPEGEGLTGLVSLSEFFAGLFHLIRSSDPIDS